MLQTTARHILSDIFTACPVGEAAYRLGEDGGRGDECERIGETEGENAVGAEGLRG